MELSAVYCRVGEYPGRIPPGVITFSWLKMSSGNCCISLLGRVVCTQGFKFVKWLRVKQKGKELQKCPFNPNSWRPCEPCQTAVTFPLNASDPAGGAFLGMPVPHHRMAVRTVVLCIGHIQIPAHQARKQTEWEEKRSNKRTFKVFFVTVLFRLIRGWCFVLKKAECSFGSKR